MKLPLLAFFALAALLSPAVQVSVDFARARGPVKPVNSVGQPPMQGGPAGFSMLHYLKEAGIPYSRLHDVGGWLGRGLWVDIPNLFPDFDADEDDPKSYVFDFTDALLTNLVANGVEPYFRLGVTIENFAGAGFAPRRILPPKDFAKWARICEHVIRHCTEGWAGGPKLGISYWEIWNEPENYAEIEKNCMWKGDFDSYMRFYGTVAPYLKSRFPHLKIGGYGSCGFYAGVDAGRVAAANSSPRTAYFVECAERFLSAARENGWPLDFFSFHSYSNPKEALRQVRYADGLLDRYGFTADRTERHFNEWLCYVGQANLGSARQAAGVAAELIGLQNGPCDLACIYDARCGVGNYSALFNPLTYKPHKAYYAFTAFNELRKLGTAVAASSDDADVFVAAAKGPAGEAVLVANASDAEKDLAFDFGGRQVRACRLTDADRTDARTDGAPSVLPPWSFCVLNLK